jgi:[acyl-carrier-protein] S-malonyltransferase
MQKLALLFPGQGAQFVGMGKALAAAYPEARAVFERADEILGLDLKKICFEGPAEELTKTAWCQPAIYVHSLAALAALKKIFPDLSFGHCAGLSLGEFTALTAAGILGFEDGLKTVHRRGVLMQEACESSQGAMAALLGGEPEKIRQVCAEAGVEIANLNGPGQIVISGDRGGIEAAIALIKERGVAKKSTLLQVAGAYHSKLMRPAAAGLAAWLEPIPLKPSAITVYANVTARPHEPAQIKKRLVEQVTGAVRWEELIRAITAEGVTHFLEVGPGEVLCNLLKRTEPSAKYAAFGKPEDLDKVSALMAEVQNAGETIGVKS